jgi:HSF-type DNA-binding
LVRQLNFYNFRKVNRERNFWVYQHRLFHRDHPETLHFLRRRTCPGVDGRKNRFSNFPRQAVVDVDLVDDIEDDDIKSSDDSTESVVSEVLTKKRSTEIRRHMVVCEKNSAPHGDLDTSKGMESRILLDLSIIGTLPGVNGKCSKSSLLDSVEDIECISEREVDEHEALREQANVVSQVALKLDEYTRKAKKSRRGQRNSLGIVTPPLVGCKGYRSVLTYDDEYEAIASRSDGKDMFSFEDCNSILGNKVLVSVTPTPTRCQVASILKPPIEDLEMVKSIRDRIMASFGDHGKKIATAAIVCFCMTNSPDVEEAELSSRIMNLLSSSDHLAREFIEYQFALRPFGCSNGSNPQFGTLGNGDVSAFSLNQSWDRAAFRREAVRDFKTFAVNYIHVDMKRMQLDENVAFALNHTEKVWSCSTCVNA